VPLLLPRSFNVALQPWKHRGGGDEEENDLNDKEDRGRRERRRMKRKKETDGE
jgi:hypothetical protein